MDWFLFRLIVGIVGAFLFGFGLGGIHANYRWRRWLNQADAGQFLLRKIYKE